jgi:eukaryotic-like serine/threonine-protein kinase
MPEIGQTITHYRIVQKLGAGGMGEVYRAQDTNLNRQVAIKVLPDLFSGDPERLARFEREAQLLASLNHPKIAMIFGLERVERELLLVMELVEGPTLAERLEKGPLPVEEALEIGRRIAEGIEAAHEKGIIHRDLKPANIKITPEGNVKILDFGLAKAMTGETEAVNASQSPTITAAMTRPGVILGTAAYMSPEQARGMMVDKRADIWAFGVVLFETLAGQTCFTGDTITDLLAAVVRAEPNWSKLPAGMPPRVRDLLRRCLTKDRKQRLRDIGDARLELEEVLAGEPANRLDAPVGNRSANAAGVSRREMGSWALAILALIAVTWLWVAGTGKQAVPERPIVSHILPPADSISCFRDGFAVSPDGRKIAFSALSSKGERLLWVRDLGRAESVPLKGTNDAIYPFWSPDSKSIGFYANGELKRIDSEGGPATLLCRASIKGSSASWGSAGTILFWTGTGLARVSQDGGEPVSISAPECWQPSFLGDGNGFVFAGAKDSRLLAFSATVGLPDRQTIIQGFTDVYGIQWAGADWFMLHRHKERTLFAQRADLKGGKVVGSPTLIAERVPFPNDVPSFSVSPAGLAAYVTNPPEALNDFASRLTWFDRQGHEVGTLGDTRGYWRVRISPGGRQVAVNPDNDIWLYDVTTGNINRLTREMDAGLWADSPIWSWHNDHLLARVDKGGATTIRDYSVSGGPAYDLDIKPGNFGPTDWSNDGRYLLIDQSEPNSDSSDLAFYDFIDKRLKSFLSTPAYESSGILSPDGHWIAYVSNKTGTSEVYVQPFPGGGKEMRVSFTGGMHPRWCRDGKELVFLTSDWRVMAAEVKLQPSLEISAPVELFRKVMADIIHGLLAPYDVSPDGQKFLVIVPVQSAPVPLTLIQNWPALTKR